MPLKMQVSKRHHFVPQFLLKEWHAADGKGFWLHFRDNRDGLQSVRRFAKSAAYVNELYTFRPDFPGLHSLGKPDVMETDFFSAIDADAALVHHKLLLDERPPLTQDDRRAWSRFVNSLMERNPARIAEIERKAASDDSIQELLKHPVAAKLRDGRADLQAMFRNSLLRALKDFIDNEEHLSYYSSLHWIVFDLSSADDHFLTGDAPLVLNAGSAPAPIHMLTIALSPKRLLIMHREDDSFDQDFLTGAAAMYSIQVTKQAHHHLISCRSLQDTAGFKYPRIVEEFMPIRRGLASRT